MASNHLDKTEADIGTEPSGFFVLRTPLFSFDELIRWSDSLKATATPHDAQQSADGFASDRRQLRARLLEATTRPEVREALFVASPDLVESLTAWERDAESARGQRIEQALVRYFSRMAGRATPFGLFAGVSVGIFGAQTHLHIEARERYERRTRLDMNYLAALVNALALDPALKKLHFYRPNSSLYPASKRFHYVEQRISENKRSHHYVAVDSSAPLLAALSCAREGARIEEITRALVGVVEAMSVAEAEEFVEEMIDNQVLVADFGPNVTGREPLRELIAQLESYPSAAGVKSRLEQAVIELEAMDAVGLGVSPARYRALAATLGELPAGELPAFSHLFHIDLVKPTVRASLGESVRAEIIRGVGIIRHLASNRFEALDRFRERFVERYGQREVPLIEALDEETGIGFDNEHPGETVPFARGLNPRDKSYAFDAASDKRQTFLLRKVYESLSCGSQEIELGAEDLIQLQSTTAPPLPDAFAVKARIIADRRGGAADDFLIELDSLSGPSGANMLARFCHAVPSLGPMVEEHLRAEERLRPDAIFAEIVYVPEERMSNILSRPVLRDFEIPYLGRSGAPLDRQLSITDLMLSVKHERIVLRSRRLGREVIPRLTSAHNFFASQNLKVYQFLCLHQRQGVASWAGWDWGVLRTLPFLPRITTGRLILSRARWTFSRDDLDPLTTSRGSARFDAVQRWRACRRLPRYLALADNDKGLPVDLDNALSVEAFVEMARKRQSVSLVEMFFSGPDELYVRGPDGHFVNELIVPFIKKREPSPIVATTTTTTAAAASRIVVRSEQRSFPPGSQWLYLKLYTGHSTMDRILRDVVLPFIGQVFGSGAIDRWFFIRYADPHWHLRLRFHGPRAQLQTEVAPLLNAAIAPLLFEGLVWRIQSDTYEREIERYGGLEATELAEEIFDADSRAVLSIVSAYVGNAGAQVRWFLTLRALDLLLSDFGLELKAKHEMVSLLRLRLAASASNSVEFRRQLGDRYREERRVIEWMMAVTLRRAGEATKGISALHRRSEQLSSPVKRLGALERAGKLTLPLFKIIPNFTHMHVNRMLKSEQRAQELVAYDFLGRYYESLIMRARWGRK